MESVAVGSSLENEGVLPRDEGLRLRLQWSLWDHIHEFWKRGGAEGLRPPEAEAKCNVGYCTNANVNRGLSGWVNLYVATKMWRKLGPVPSSGPSLEAALVLCLVQRRHCASTIRLLAAQMSKNVITQNCPSCQIHTQQTANCAQSTDKSGSNSYLEGTVLPSITESRLLLPKMSLPPPIRTGARCCIIQYQVLELSSYYLKCRRSTCPAV